MTHGEPSGHDLERGLLRRLAWFGTGLFFVALAVAITWPLASRVESGLPLGSEDIATVPLFNLWTLAWNAEHLGQAGYWQAPIFHPARDAFAYSEPQPLTGGVAMLLTALTGSVVAAYNLILLAALALNGLLAAVSFRAFGLAWLPALAGGSLVLVLPFTHQELGVLQLVPLVGVFALSGAAVWFATAPGPARGLVLGAGLALAMGISVQTAVFAVLVLGPATLWLLGHHLRSRRTWGGLLVAALGFLLLASPMLLAQQRATTAEEFERSIDSVRKHSAQPGQYLKSAWPETVPNPLVKTAKRPSQRAFWPGTLRCLLALCALWIGLRDPAWRRATVAVALVLGSSFVLSLGANLEWAGISLAEMLRALPGLSQLRSFFRFALFVQLAVVVLATLGLEFIQRRTATRWTAPRARLFVAVLALLAILEIRPTMGPIQDLPPLDLDLPWLSWVVESTGPDDVLAFIPFPEGRSSEDYLGTAQWMYWQIRHGRPMVNGYSGFFPAHFRQLKQTMRSFPSGASLRALRAAGVRYCVVHRAYWDGSGAAGSEDSPRLVPVFQDRRHALDIYELR